MRPQEGVKKEIPSEDLGMGLGMGLGSKAWECGRCGVPSVWSEVNKKQAARARAISAISESQARSAASQCQ